LKDSSTSPKDSQQQAGRLRQMLSPDASMVMLQMPLAVGAVQERPQVPPNPERLPEALRDSSHNRAHSGIPRTSKRNWLLFLAGVVVISLGLLLGNRVLHWGSTHVSANVD